MRVGFDLIKPLYPFPALFFFFFGPLFGSGIQHMWDECEMRVKGHPFPVEYLMFRLCFLSSGISRLAVV